MATGFIVVNQNTFDLGKIGVGETLTIGASSVTHKQEGHVVVQCAVDDAVSLENCTAKSVTLNRMYRHAPDTLNFAVECPEQYKLQIGTSCFDVAPFVYMGPQKIDGCIISMNNKVLTISGITENLRNTIALVKK